MSEAVPNPLRADTDGYQWVIEYLSAEGDALGTLPFEPDWGPAREWAQLRALAAEAGAVPTSRFAVEPVWDDEAGAPVVSAAKMVAPGIAGDELATRPYFRAAAKAGSAQMVERGVLARGDTYRFRVCAFAQATTRDEDPGGGLVLDVEDASSAPRVGARALAPFRAATVHREACDDDLDVFVPQPVLDECRAHARSAATVETGGVFMGRLWRATERSRLFLEITGVVPVPHTDAASTRLTFTHESWAAVSAAIALRGDDELMCGWFHFHPRFCAKCPPASREVCQFARPFFSAEDVHMHRAVFPRAFHVALLVSDLGEDDYDASFFGWREGRVEARGYDVIHA